MCGASACVGVRVCVCVCVCFENTPMEDRLEEVFERKLVKYTKHINSAVPDAFRGGGEPHWTLRCRVLLVFFECYSLDLPLWLTLPGRRGSCNNPSEIFFFQVSGCCTVTNYAFSFCTSVFFSCFCGIMTQVKLVKHKFPN